MKIALISALYPPDIAPSALYIKELAIRLKTHNSVSIGTYGYIPERIESVEILYTSKNRPIFFRLFFFTKLLLQMCAHNELFYVENGASVELPLFLASRIRKIPYIVHRGDLSAHEFAQKKILLRSLERFIEKESIAVITSNPLSRPETLPFETPSDTAMYEESWRAHLKEINAYLL
jgi:hypothetical protein